MKKPLSRRGAAVAAVVLVLVAVQMTAVTTLGGGADESDRSLRRVMAARAQAAGDSGAVIASTIAHRSLTLPAAGDSLSIGTLGKVVYVSLPAAGKAGDIVVEGRSDNSVRRFRVTLSEE